MESLAMGGGVIAIISLAGQVVQGCSYLRNVFGDVKDAPEDLRLIVCELGIIQQFADTLDHENQSDTAEAACWDPAPALEFCNEAIEKLKKLVATYGDRASPNGRIKWSKRLSMAMSVDKTRKYLKRLENAKTNLLTTANTRILSKVGSALSMTEDIQRQVELGGIHHQKTASVLTKTANAIDDLKQSATTTLAAIQGLSQSITAEAGGTQDRLSQVVEYTIQKVLEQHLVRVSQPDTDKSSEVVIEERTTSSVKNERTVRYSSKAIDTFDVDVTTYYREKSQRLVIRAAKSQYDSNVWIYQTWFGQVKMRTVYIQHHWDSGKDCTFDREARTDILVQPNSFVLQRGAMIKYEQQRWLSTSNMSINSFAFRIFNIVQPDSALFKACRRGDVNTMRTLFYNREASPFDRDEAGDTILDLAFSMAIDLLWGDDPDISSSARRNNYKAESCQNCLEIMELAVKSGLDTGTLITPIQRLLEFDRLAASISPLWDEFLSQVTRLVIRGARSDPFENFDVCGIHRGFWKPSSFSVTSVVLEQDSWCIDWTPMSGHSIGWKFPSPAFAAREISDLLASMASAQENDTETALTLCNLQCRILGLTLAAGFNPQSVHEYRQGAEVTSANDGCLLHIAISQAYGPVICSNLKWPSSEVRDTLKLLQSDSQSLKNQFVPVNSSDPLRKQGGRPPFSRIASDLHGPHPRHDLSAIKLVKLMYTCLTHGINPLSRNKLGDTVTSYARQYGVLPYWKFALSNAGFDAAKIIENSRDIFTGWEYGDELARNRCAQDAWDGAHGGRRLYQLNGFASDVITMEGALSIYQGFQKPLEAGEEGKTTQTVDTEDPDSEQAKLTVPGEWKDDWT